MSFVKGITAKTLCLIPPTVSQTLSTLGEEKNKRKQFYWVSCIRILKERGSKLEARITLGHFDPVHHSKFTHNMITEIKQTSITEEYYCHFSFVLPFQEYVDSMSTKRASNRHRKHKKRNKNSKQSVFDM